MRLAHGGGMSLLQDLRFAVRSLMKSPVFGAVAVFTLALGIGANAAIFSVLNAVLIKPLPYADPGRLVMVWQDLRARGGPATEWTGPSQQFDWKAETDVFENLASVRGWNASLAGGDLPESVLGEQTTYEYFDVLGAQPALGRTFRGADDVPNAPRVAVLSHALWTRRFGGDPSVVGRTTVINGESHEIIGVMPEGFRPVVVTNAALWRPQRMRPVNPSRNTAVNRTVGRLRRGVSLDAARVRLAALAARLEQAHPESDTKKGINPVPLQEQQVGAMKPALFVLQAAVAFVLVIACVNIANLLLARASARIREIAIRRALGAGRRRIVSQLLTESLVLAAAGGGLGALIAVWGVSALKAVAPEGTPRIEEVGVDWRVLAFAAALALATGVIFGLVPAMHASRDEFAPALKQGGRGQTGDGGGRLRRGLIVAELALALVLLAGGGLLLRTFLALGRADLGFNPDHVVAGFVLPPPAVYKDNPHRLAFYDALLSRAAAIPGVASAALSSVIPLGGDSDTSFDIEGRPPATRSADALIVWYRVVSANYFATMEIPLRRGRLFADREADPSLVINETMAKRHWPGEDPLGRRIRFDRDGPWFSIVGVVADVQVRGARGDAHEVEAYMPYWHNPEPGVNIVLKTAIDPAALAEPLRRVVKEVDPGVAVAGVSTMNGMIADSIVDTRFQATLVAAFAGLALVLAATGLYGVTSYAVAQRTSEIGIRLALGAAEPHVFRLVVGDALRLATIGLMAGLGGAIAAGRVLEKLLFGVTETDPLTLGLTSALLMLVAFLASYVPARRAMRIDPMEALRIE